MANRNLTGLVMVCNTPELTVSLNIATHTSYGTQIAQITIYHGFVY
jgi:hypothetical protein